MLKFFKLLLLVSCYQFCWAEIPRVFAPGLPAKASEVNQNFSYLEGEISHIKDASALCDSKLFDNYDPVYIDEPVGTVLMIGGNRFEIAKFPFVEAGTGDRYSIKMPVLMESCSSNCAGYYMAHVPFSTFPRVVGNDFSGCGVASLVSGFPVGMQISPEISYGTDFYSGKFEISKSINGIAYILVNNSTFIKIFLNFDGIKISSSAVLPADRDYTDNVNLASLSHDYPDQWLWEIFNRIKIEKIPN